jgi:hypothetical protein
MKHSTHSRPTSLKLKSLLEIESILSILMAEVNMTPPNSRCTSLRRDHHEKTNVDTPPENGVAE